MRQKVRIDPEKNCGEPTMQHADVCPLHGSVDATAEIFKMEPTNERAALLRVAARCQSDLKRAGGLFPGRAPFLPRLFEPPGMSPAC
jgi:hypothetical protein